MESKHSYYTNTKGRGCRARLEGSGSISISISNNNNNNNNNKFAHKPKQGYETLRPPRTPSVTPKNKK